MCVFRFHLWNCSADVYELSIQIALKIVKCVKNLLLFVRSRENWDLRELYTKFHRPFCQKRLRYTEN